MIKISRDLCIIKYRKFPLSASENDVMVDYYPEVISRYWMKLKTKSTKELGSKLSKQLTQLYQNLEIKDLIFLCDYNRYWISSFTSKRTDYSPLIEAVKYFTKHKIGSRFNGGIKVDIAELPAFIEHYFTFTECDGGFTYYHFLDENQNLLGSIHYSGEVSFDVLNQKFDSLFLNEIKKTSFQKTGRE